MNLYICLLLFPNPSFHRLVLWPGDPVFKNRESYHCTVGFDRFQRPIYFTPLILCAPGFRLELHKKHKKKKKKNLQFLWILGKIAYSFLNMYPVGIEFVQKARTELVSSWALITLRCFFCWMPTLSKKCICCDKWKENIFLETKIVESLVAIICASENASVTCFHFPWTSVLFFPTLSIFVV